MLKSITKPLNKIIYNSRRSYSEPVLNIMKKIDVAEERVVKVAIIGMPNAGKSTLINSLMDRKVCPTSSKVHTTRGISRAVLTDKNTQVVFLDTPGLVNEREVKRFNLGKPFLKDSAKSLKEADVIGVIHDVSDPYTREILDIKIIKNLQNNKSVESFLVLNKVDILKSKRKLFDIVNHLTSNCLRGKQSAISVKSDKESTEDVKNWKNFSEIFMVSSLTGSGIEDIKNYLIKKGKQNKWLYSATDFSDQSPENIVVNTVKAKLLDLLPQEIPYQLVPTMEYFEIHEDGSISTVVIVKCPSTRILKLVSGASDGKIRQIMRSVQDDLQKAFQNYVKLKIVLE